MDWLTRPTLGYPDPPQHDQGQDCCPISYTTEDLFSVVYYSTKPITNKFTVWQFSKPSVKGMPGKDVLL